MLTQVSDPIIVGENAHFIATNEEFVWKVIVTPEALGALTHDRSTPISSATLCGEVLTRIADHNLSKLDTICKWVMEADVERLLAGQVVRWKSQQVRDRASVVPPSSAPFPWFESYHASASL